METEAAVRMIEQDIRNGRPPAGILEGRLPPGFDDWEFFRAKSFFDRARAMIGGKRASPWAS
jgi:hypothetical protein